MEAYVVSLNMVMGMPYPPNRTSTRFQSTVPHHHSPRGHNRKGRNQPKYVTYLKVILSIAIIVAVVVGAYVAYRDGEDGFPANWPSAAPEDEALDEIFAWHEQMDIAPQGSQDGYDRDLFGPAWADTTDTVFGGNGCDTRNDILIRDLTDITFRDDDPGCTVATGVLDDPYTGRVIEFTRGAATSHAVQIDHVVSLSNAWKTGARYLSEDDRRALSNDPLNLLASDGPANMGKSDKDAAEWLPANEAFHCQFAARQVAVKHRYQLWATPEEHGALWQSLNTCQDADLPSLARLVEGREAGRA